MTLGKILKIMNRKPQGRGLDPFQTVSRSSLPFIDIDEYGGTGSRNFSLRHSPDIKRGNRTTTNNMRNEDIEHVMGLAAKAFDKIDVNGDGQLDRDEVV